MDIFYRVLEFIIGCKFSARHFFQADIRRIESDGEFGAPQLLLRIFGGQKFGGESGERRRLRGLCTIEL